MNDAPSGRPGALLLLRTAIECAHGHRILPGDVRGLSVREALRRDARGASPPLRAAAASNEERRLARPRIDRLRTYWWDRSGHHGADSPRDVVEGAAAVLGNAAFLSLVKETHRRGRGRNYRTAERRRVTVGFEHTGPAWRLPGLDTQPRFGVATSVLTNTGSAFLPIAGMLLCPESQS